MMDKAIVAILFLISAANAQEYGTGIGEPLPSFLKVCHRSDPNLNECVKQSVEGLKPHLAEGIPELGIPPCEPLIVPKVVVNQGKGSAVSVTSTYKNLHVYGPTKFTLKNVKVDVNANRIRVKLFLPYLYITGEYLLEGRILMLPIQGHGRSTGNYTNIDATLTIIGSRVMHNEREYMDVKKFTVSFEIGHASIHLGNLFDGDEELGATMNKFLNENWKAVAREIQPILQNSMADLFKTFCNKLYHKYPLDVLLPN